MTETPQNSTGAMSASSSTHPSALERSAQSSNQSKHSSRPRKRFHGTATFRRAFLITDRMKPQSQDVSQKGKAPQSPRKPPGLSSPENTIETESGTGEEKDSDGELCFICGNSMKERYYSLSPCNNAFCHNCSLRLRALYKSMNCPFCKVSRILHFNNGRPNMIQ